MTVGFSPEQWTQIRENALRWWDDSLERPLIQVIVTGRDPGRPEPKLPYHKFQSFYDFAVPAEEIIDRVDYEMSKNEYLGDAFPHFWPNFGPGIAAAFLGSAVTPYPHTTWFHPAVEREVRDLHFEYDSDNRWLRRVKELMQAAMARWNGRVQVGMTDLGGNLDLLSSFRPSEQLLYDLVDEPEHVKRLTWEAHDLWWRYFEELNTILQPANPGYTAWAPVFSETSYYMLQCDFCYMLGPAMFEEFVRPELVASCKRLDHAFYHLDGPGELPHLTSLLAIPELKGIQWVPGSGAKEQGEWPEVYRETLAAGKRAQIFGHSDGFGSKQDFHWFERLVPKIGSPKGFVMLNATAPANRRAEALEFLARFGAA